MPRLTDFSDLKVRSLFSIFCPKSRESCHVPIPNSPKNQVAFTNDHLPNRAYYTHLIHSYITCRLVMVYISADGSLSSTRKRTIFGFLSDLVTGTIETVLLFFRTITHGTQALEGRRRSTYAERQMASRSSGRRPRGPNIRGVKNLGDANCPVGGG